MRQAEAEAGHARVMSFQNICFHLLPGVRVLHQFSFLSLVLFSCTVCKLIKQETEEMSNLTFVLDVELCEEFFPLNMNET